MAQAQVIALPFVVAKTYRFCLELSEVVYSELVPAIQTFGTAEELPSLWLRYAPFEKKGQSGTVRLRCPRKACRSEVTLQSGTFFEASLLPIEKIVRILHLWSSKTPVGKMMVEAEICNKTAIDWCLRTVLHRPSCYDWRTWS